ncbi:tRNA pseudouridine synthase B [Oceanotoga teriensis]|uniref:tRNA pseudouridine synthase B n=2 Tax=Oceanotoga teriensis TaxID=515440 RepID=A0AA45HJR5_9BACT|nr:tRNA pseudouridine synthase B [Oceanotoga teriensis]
MMNNGFLIVNKPENMTSHDVVSIARKKLNTKKIGHTGTLDPFATGVLILGINKGTKFIEFLNKDIKKYFVRGKLGEITDTFDKDGKVVEQNEVTNEDIKKIEPTIMSLLGKRMQTPPSYCAKKYKGKRLYEYARKGEIINLPPHEIEIFSIENFSQEGKEFEFEVTVSAGTYIRSLIMEIGYIIGPGAVTIELKRTQAGNMNILNTIDINDISYEKIISINEVLNIPILKVNNSDKIKNGIQIYKEFVENYEKFKKDNFVKLIDENDNFFGIAKAEKNSSFIKTLIKNNERNDRIAKIYKILR